MRNFLGIFASLLISLPILAQTQWNKAGIQEMMDNYTKYTLAKDYEKSLDYLHPFIFDFAPKETFVASFEKMDNDPEMKTHFDDFTLNKIGKITTYKGIHYATVYYALKMRFQFLLETEEGNTDVDDFLFSLYEAQFGEGNVSLERSTRTFSINGERQLFAIGDPSIGDWKMLENKMGMEEIMEGVIPKKVRKRLMK